MPHCNHWHQQKCAYHLHTLHIHICNIYSAFASIEFRFAFHDWQVEPCGFHLNLARQCTDLVHGGPSLWPASHWTCLI